MLMVELNRGHTAGVDIEQRCCRVGDLERESRGSRFWFAHIERKCLMNQARGSNSFVRTIARSLRDEWNEKGYDFCDAHGQLRDQVLRDG
jgi:hypothetical protein